MNRLETKKCAPQNTRHGAGDNQFGVRLGEIKKLAKKIKANHELAISLWDTKNIDARLLATLIIKPKELSLKEMDEIVQSVTFNQVADWLNAYVVKNHPKNEKLRQLWMSTNQPMAARAGWNLTAARVVRSPEGLKLTKILDQIENEMGNAPSQVQWAMNSTLAQIGIQFPEHRERALVIGEKLGIYRDYPTSKGCTSPFAPIWINEMVRRQE